jgi:1,4-dihydroxy-2-naphthoate phytyltransferase
MHELLPSLKGYTKKQTGRISLSVKSSTTERKHLWQAAIKWPLYSVAIMPVIVSAGWELGNSGNIRLGQFIGFLIASILILLWENLTNDLFDDETGVDKYKFHSVVALTGSKSTVSRVAYFSLLLGLFIIFILALKSKITVLFLVIICCFLGYLYQGPPFRLGYKGLGEPLCWIAFGPLATAAALIVISPTSNFDAIPWGTALIVGAGPAMATTLVLFCSHFHQINQDAAVGKKSPLVVLGTNRAANFLPWLVGLIFLLELLPVLNGVWPITTLMCLISLPSGLDLIKLIKSHHNKPELIKNSKFSALRFQTINGLCLSMGFATSYFFL